MTFSKLDSGITKSSLWSEALHVRIVFVSFLAEKDDTGFVSGSRSGMIRICNVTPEQFDDAIKVLSSPDTDSRTKDFDGRRIESVEGGWIVINHEKYRLPEREKKESHAEYMRNWRKNKECENVNSREFTGDHNVSPSVSVSVSDSVSSEEDSKEKQTVHEKTFEKFWAAYPKKKSKGDAIKAWNKIKSPAETLAKILTALEWQKKSKDWTKEFGQYIPYPASYLNSNGWEDEKEEQQNLFKQQESTSPYRKI